MDRHKQLFESYIQAASIINDLVFDDVGVGVFDQEKLLYYKPGLFFDLGTPAGEPVKPSMGVYIAMREKMRIVRKVDKSAFGKPYITVATPILGDDGQVVGAVSVTQSTDRQDALKKMAGSLGDSLTVLMSTAEEISAQTREVAATSQLVTKVAKESSDRVSEIYKVMDLLKSVAQQTNLLGLNAAIEAARVGEAGRGFGVVAGEIRNLASDSAGSVQSITPMLNAMYTDSRNIYDQINKVENAIGEVSQAICGVASAVQQVNAMLGELDRLADSLSQDIKSAVAK